MRKPFRTREEQAAAFANMRKGYVPRTFVRRQFIPRSPEERKLIGQVVASKTLNHLGNLARAAKEGQAGLENFRRKLDQIDLERKQKLVLNADINKLASAEKLNKLQKEAFNLKEKLKDKKAVDWLGKPLQDKLNKIEKEISQYTLSTAEERKIFREAQVKSAEASKIYSEKVIKRAEENLENIIEYNKKIKEQIAYKTAKGLPLSEEEQRVSKQRVISPVAITNEFLSITTKIRNRKISDANAKIALMSLWADDKKAEDIIAEEKKSGEEQPKGKPFFISPASISADIILPPPSLKSREDKVQKLEARNIRQHKEIEKFGKQLKQERNIAELVDKIIPEIKRNKLLSARERKSLLKIGEVRIRELGL